MSSVLLWCQNCLGYCHCYTINRSNINIEEKIINPGKSFILHLILQLSSACRNSSLAALMSLICCKWLLQRHQCCYSTYRRVTTVATICVLKISAPTFKNTFNLPILGPILHPLRHQIYFSSIFI